MEAQRHARARGTIYAIGAVGTSLVKIGSTRATVEKRLQTLQVGQPFPLQILAMVAVEVDVRRIEAQIHAFLAARRHRGEWFEAPMDLTQLEVLVGRARQEIAAQDAARAQRPQDVHGPQRMDLGATIRHRREQLGLSQMELARLLDVAPSRISDFERGAKTDCTLSTAKRLARALGCGID